MDISDGYKLKWLADNHCYHYSILEDKKELEIFYRKNGFCKDCESYESKGSIQCKMFDSDWEKKCPGHRKNRGRLRQEEIEKYKLIKKEHRIFAEILNKYSIKRSRYVTKCLNGLLIEFSENKNDVHFFSTTNKNLLPDEFECWLKKILRIKKYKKLLNS